MQHQGQKNKDSRREKNQVFIVLVHRTTSVERREERQVEIKEKVLLFSAEKRKEVSKGDEWCVARLNLLSHRRPFEGDTFLAELSYSLLIEQRQHNKDQRWRSGNRQDLFFFLFYLAFIYFTAPLYWPTDCSKMVESFLISASNRKGFSTCSSCTPRPNSSKRPINIWAHTHSWPYLVTSVGYVYTRFTCLSIYFPPRDHFEWPFRPFDLFD